MPMHIHAYYSYIFVYMYIFTCPFIYIHVYEYIHHKCIFIHIRKYTHVSILPHPLMLTYSHTHKKIITCVCIKASSMTVTRMWMHIKTYS